MVEPRTPADRDADAPLEFCIRLARAHAVMTRRLDAGLSALHGLSFNDFTILLHLSRAPGRRLRRIDLAERLGLTASGVTRTLLPLEKLGWVARQTDPRDARVAHAILTEPGQALLGHALVTATQVGESVTQAFSGARRHQLSEALGQLAGLHAANA